MNRLRVVRNKPGTMAILKTAQARFRVDRQHYEAYDVIRIPEEPHGPQGWWTVTCNGIPDRHFSLREKAERYATDPAFAPRSETAR